jgi:hypothetical protein
MIGGGIPVGCVRGRVEPTTARPTDARRERARADPFVRYDAVDGNQG